MPERSVVTRYDAKIDGYLASMAKMKAATEGFAKTGATSMTKHKADWDKVSKAAVIGGAVIGVAVLGAAKAYMDFEAAMSGVAAVAEATAKQQRELSKAAIQSGQDTVFSATEAAKAEAELAKAGVSVTDILGGGLKGSLDLAAAGQIGLAESATIAAQAMNIFDKSGKDVGHIADVLTAGANKSAAGVDDLGLALAQGGLVAKQTGLTLEDTVGTLSAFADNALKGSDAGTSLKTMLQRLNPQSDEAADLMDKLNLRAYDAQGNFVGVAQYAGKLQAALKDMSAEQRNATLSTLFGSDAVRGANVLYENGEAGIRQYIAAVDDQGAAARMAAKQTDNLKGDLEQLKGTLESAFINAGSGGNSGLRSIVQQVTNLVDLFNKLSPSAQATTVQIAALTAATLLVGGAGIKATTSILAMKASMDAAGISSARLAVGMKAIGAASIVVGVAAVANELAQLAPNADVAQVGVDKLAASLSGLANGREWDTKGLQDLFGGEATGPFADDIDSASKALDQFALSAQVAIGTNWGDRVEQFLSPTDAFTDQVGQMDAALAKLVQNGDADAAAQAFARLISSVDKANAAGAGIPVDEVKAKFTEYQAALDETAVSSDGVAGAAEDLSDATYESAKAARDAADGTKTWADELDAINSPILNARDAARQFEESVDDARAALKENGKTLDIHTAKGRANQEALDNVARSAIDQAKALQENGASQTTLNAKMDTSRDKLIAVAEKFGMSKREAKAYADQVLKTPKAVTTTITAKTEAAKAKVTAFQQQVNRLRGNDVTIGVRYVVNGRLPNGGINLQGGITKNAEGGEIRGPGTATSDSIPALLSNGEHVLTAKEVEKAGGHDAIYRMRRGINTGALKFADGGPAGPARFAAGGAVGFAEGGGVDLSRILQIAADLAAAGDRRKYGARVITAASQSNRSTKAFLDNVDKLTRMGFKTLALSLLDQGGPEAEAIAAQAVVSASKAKSLQAQLSTQSALSDREAAMRAALTGQSLAGITPELGWYSQVRDLGPMARGAHATGTAAVTNINVNITGPIDSMSAGREVEKVLQQYTSVTGRPLQVVTQ
jgi:TP901 family phage tail tape measure protein